MPDPPPSDPGEDRPIEPIPGLARLAATVDGDAAADAFARARRRRRHRRRAAIGVGAAVIAVTGSIGVLAALRDEGAPQRVTAGPQSTTSTGEPTETTGGSEEPLVLRAERDGVRLDVSARSPLRVGTVVDVDVTVTNDRPVPVTWSTGGCAILAQLWVLTPGETPDDMRSPGFPPDATIYNPVSLPWHPWNGDPEEIEVSASSGLWSSVPTGPSGRNSTPSPLPSLDCPAIALTQQIPPGGTERQAMWVDLRLQPAPLDDRELYVRFSDTIDQSDGGPIVEHLDAHAPLAFVDDPRRLATVDDALAAMAADPHVDTWARSHAGKVAPSRQVIVQPGTLLRWVDGQWELWLAPDPVTQGNLTYLRVRWDAERRRVVDVRTVINYKAAADDEGVPQADRDNDQARVLFHLD